MIGPMTLTIGSFAPMHFAPLFDASYHELRAMYSRFIYGAPVE